MDDKTHTYRRTELYEQVWAEPMRKLAPRYGVSDVALAKICRRLGIPLPGVGHWTKVACGHHVERPPLPPPTADQPEELVVHRPPPPIRPPVVPEAIPDVKVSDQLRHPHQLVVKTKMLAREYPRNGDMDGRCKVRWRGGLDVMVSPGSLRRALTIMDAILKHLERCGYDLGVGRKRPFPTYVVIKDQQVAFQLREGTIRTKRLPTEKDRYPYPAFDTQPNGVFTLEIKEYVDGLRKVWRDGKRRTLEQQLGAFVVGLEQAAARLKEQHEEFLRREREREAERIREAELEARRREEQRRVDELMNQLGRWRKSEALRGFVAATKTAALAKYGRIEEGSELDTWLKWAQDVADRLDPLRTFKASPTI